MTSPKVESERPPKVGDRVRVVIEGDVEANSGGEYLYVMSDNGRSHGFYLPNLPEPVEVLPPPEPEYAPGDVVLDAHGCLLVRVGEYRSKHGNTYEWLKNGVVGHGLGDSAVSRPLTPLVVGGKPVSAA